jgi:DNA replication and repair protein RecF
MRAGGVPQSAIAQWLGQLQVVAFFPHDLVLITGEPGERRRFLNLELGKTRPAHFADTARYRRALQQRNALVRHLAETRHRHAPAEALTTLGEWNRQLISYGARILAQRAQFLEELRPLLREVHRKLSGLQEPFAVHYQPGVKLPAQRGAEAREAPLNGGAENWSKLLAASLDADHESDMRRGTTASGPHRDDLTFTLGDMDLRRYGSQGQQRLAVLALKVALAHWVAQATGEPPVLLLDDALSELDATRCSLLLEEARHFPQCVITATGDALLRHAAAVFHVEAGNVSLQSGDSTAGLIEAPTVEFPTSF